MSDEIIVQPISYVVSPKDKPYPCYYVAWRGQDEWCVVWSASVYDFATGEWELEPSPSNRSDEFIANTRRPLEVCFEKAKELVRETLTQL